MAATITVKVDNISEDVTTPSRILFSRISLYNSYIETLRGRYIKDYLSSQKPPSSWSFLGKPWNKEDPLYSFYDTEDYQDFKTYYKAVQEDYTRFLDLMLLMSSPYCEGTINLSLDDIKFIEGYNLPAYPRCLLEDNLYQLLLPLRVYFPVTYKGDDEPIFIQAGEDLSKYGTAFITNEYGEKVYKGDLDGFVGLIPYFNYFLSVEGTLTAEGILDDGDFIVGTALAHSRLELLLSKNYE